MTLPVTPGSVWRAALRRPVRTLLCVAIVLVPFAVLSTSLRFEPRIDLLAPAHPLSRAEATRRDTFGADPRLILAVTRDYKRGGALAEPCLETLLDLHRGLEALEGIRRVSSLVNAPALIGGATTAAGEPLWHGSTDRGRERLVEAIRGSEMQRFMLLSALWSLTPLYVETDPGVNEAELVSRIRELIRDVEQRHPDGGTVLLVGPAVVDGGLGDAVFKDMYRLIPFAVALVLAGMLLVTRRISFLLVVLLHSVALLVAVLGGMAAFGLRVNLVSVLAPVVLVPIGVADLLHLLVRLEAGAPAVSPGSAFADLEQAMLRTSLTSAVAFLGFLISPVAAIRQFGLTLSAGVLVALALTLTLDAALLSLVWRGAARRSPVRRRSRRSVVRRWLLALAASPVRQRNGRRLGWALSILALAVGAIAMSKLRVEDTWIGNFDPDSRVAADVRAFERVFLGTNVVALVVEADPGSPAAQERAIAAVNELGRSFVMHEGMRGALSAVLLARAFDPQQGKPWDPWPSPTPVELERALAAWDERGLALPRVSSLVDPRRSRFQVLIFVLNQPLADLTRIAGEIRERAHSLADGIEIRVGGDLVTNIEMVRTAVASQGQAMIAVVLVMLTLAIAFTRSLAGGAVLILPMAVATLASYATLVLLRIPYGIAVSMFPALVIGLALDFAIHLRSALVRARDASRRAWTRDLAAVVRGIQLNGLLWSAGFAVLAVSGLPPNRALGLLCSLVVALSTLATLVLLPVAMRTVERR